MLWEVLLSLGFLFVIFWVETFCIWQFLSMFYEDRGFYQGDGVLPDDLGPLLYVLSSRVDTLLRPEMQT